MPSFATQYGALVQGVPEQGLLDHVAVLVHQRVGQRVDRVGDRQRMGLGDHPVGQCGGGVGEPGSDQPAGPDGAGAEALAPP